MRFVTAVIVISLAMGLQTPRTAAQDVADEGATSAAAIVRGDAAWARRGEGQRGGRARPGPIDEALAAYEEALAADPRSLEAHWKLLRAIYFKGDFTTDDRDKKKEIFGRGKEVSDSAFDLLAEHVGGRKALDDMEPAELRRALSEPAAGRVYFWSAVAWGLWGENHGKMAAARQGVAGRIRDYSLAVIELDPRYEHGGGYRIHSRLHTEAPRIPFVTGWIDRKRAAEDIRRAFEISPDYPDNRFYLADTYLRFEREKKGEALAILRGLAEMAPKPETVTEDTAVSRKARDLLDEVAR